MDRHLAKYYKEHYPAGTRIMIVHMNDDDPRPIPDGTKGTVNCVDAAGTLHCTFDNGRMLGICPEVDSFHKIEEHEHDNGDDSEDNEPEM